VGLLLLIFGQAPKFFNTKKSIDFGIMQLHIMAKKISGGTAHSLPADLRKALASDAKALAAWENLTPLARNEWICWSISVKRPETRKEHVERVCPELKDGMRRPCCWIGCTHRKDKPLSRSQKFILGRKSKK
jgi:hypothetical protein